MIVVDVNVIAYLFLDGEPTSESEALLAVDPEWAVPLLWRSEWRSILTGYLRRGTLDREGALELTLMAQRLVGGREYAVSDAAVLDEVATTTLSSYDAEYVALARTLRVPLATHDRAVLASVPDLARKPGSFLG